MDDKKSESEKRAAYPVPSQTTVNVLDVVKLRSRQVIQDKSKFSVLGDCKKQCTTS